MDNSCMGNTLGRPVMGLKENFVPAPDLGINLTFLPEQDTPAWIQGCFPPPLGSPALRPAPSHRKQQAAEQMTFFLPSLLLCASLQLRRGLGDYISLQEDTWKRRRMGSAQGLQRV